MIKFIWEFHLTNENKSKQMKKLMIILIITFVTTLMWAQVIMQEKEARPFNNINVNLLGNASIISINYERLFQVHPKILIAGNIGFGYNLEFTLFDDHPESFTTIPMHVTGNYGKMKNMLEFGVGYTIINDKKEYWKNATYAIIGYRIQPFESGKTNFRVFVMPPISDMDATSILFIPIGLSFGHCF